MPYEDWLAAEREDPVGPARRNSETVSGRVGGKVIMTIEVCDAGFLFAIPLNRTDTEHARGAFRQLQ